MRTAFLKGALGLLLGLGTLLGGSSIATAADYFGDCSNVPSSTTGNVTVIDSTSCNIGHPVSATGAVFISVSSGSITTQAITASGGDVTASAPAGSVTTGAVSASGKGYIRADNGDVTTDGITVGGGDLQVITTSGSGKITVNGTVTGTNTTQVYYSRTTISLKDVVNSNGDVRIFANQGGGTDPFTVGTSSSNGVLSVHNNGNTAFRYVYISNGDGNGGIQYSGSNVLQVQNSSGQAGAIVLDGRAAGKVTLSGTLSVDGASGQRSGAVDIFGPEVEILGAGATINANSPGQQLGFINIATAKVTLSGSLTVNVNGNGPLPGFYDLSIFPAGSYSLTVPTDPAQPITANPYTDPASPVQITGAGALTISANGNNNGVKIHARPLTINNTGGVTVTQEGSANETFIGGTGGAGTATINKITVHANNTASGQSPNSIKVLAGNIPALTSNILLDASGKSGTAASGSNIQVNVTSGTVKLGGTGNVFTLTANGGTTGGAGGNVTIGAPTVTFDNDNAIGASAITGNDKGGAITVTATSVGFTAANQSVRAEGAGSGEGGSIAFTTGSTFNPTASNATLNARGGASGKGGTITLSHTANFDVNQYLFVDSGSSAAVTVQSGTLVLNGITCGQWKTGNGSWLEAYWSCANPTAPNVGDLAIRDAADGLGAVKNLFDTNGVRLYVFLNGTDYNTFFTVTSAAATDAGFTRNMGTKTYSAVFRNNGAILPTNTLKEITVHELGHATSILNANEGSGTIYSTWAQHDFMNLDYTAVGTNDVTSTRRAPCSTNGTAPFDGLAADTNGQAICSGGTVTAAYIDSSTGLPYRNSKIAQLASAHFRWYGSTARWRELYPQRFAYDGIGFGLSPFPYPMADGLFNKGWFSCAQTWAAARLNNTAPPTSPACSAAIPAWYTTQVTTQ